MLHLQWSSGVRNVICLRRPHVQQRGAEDEGSAAMAEEIELRPQATKLFSDSHARNEFPNGHKRLLCQAKELELGASAAGR